MRSLPVLPSFFFSRARPNRHLSSFPTRRSSDLKMIFEEYDACLRSIGLRHIHHLHVDSREEMMNVAKANAADRKSTRLNSSHRCISYAVFCLKKKKSQASETPTPGPRQARPVRG